MSIAAAAVIWLVIIVHGLAGALAVYLYYRPPGWRDRYQHLPPPSDDPQAAALAAAAKMSSRAWEVEQAMFHVAQQSRREGRS